LNKLKGRTILVTGAARRIGRIIALAVAREGANVILHYRRSVEEANELRDELASLGVQGYPLQADLEDKTQAGDLLQRARAYGPVFGLVNNAAIFEPLNLEKTDQAAWDRHLAVNLTAPFLLSRAFAGQVPTCEEGRIINILDWRALRPTADHFAYTISKAALAAMTRSLAVALAPRITVNGLALGAILPPSGQDPTPDILSSVPANRWASPEELSQALIFLITGPAYITGEIIHLDGGRHLV
jgi:NAD(P)-dependent dehydrogenase (short-subunit alcohol dehydrogenase family)